MRCKMAFLLLLFVLLAACGQPGRVLPAATLVDTQAALPTLTPTPTATPSPTPLATQRPTATATIMVSPSPTVTATLAPPPDLLATFPGARLVRRVSFNKGGQSVWYLPDPKSGSDGPDGSYELVGQDGTGSYLRRNAQFTAEQGLVFDFKFNQGAVCQFNLENGQPATYDYRQFSVVSCASSYISLTSGESRIGLRFIGGNMALQPDSWYRLALGLADGGQFSLRVWDKADPRHYLQYQEKLGVKWNSLTWKFSAEVDGAGQVLEMKEYGEFVY